MYFWGKSGKFHDHVSLLEAIFLESLLKFLEKCPVLNQLKTGVK